MRNERSFTHSYLICSGNEEGRRRKAEEIGLSALLGGKEGALERPFSNHPDVLLIEPDSESKSLAITINQIREFERKINLKPYIAAFKVVIIKEAQRMTMEAQNALLKTLEEPPARSVLILTALQPSLLLPTIVSRCRKVILKPKVGIEIESETHRTAVKEFLEILEMSIGERLFWVEENKSLVGNSRSAIELLNSWVSVLRDSILVEGGIGSKVLNKELLSPGTTESSGSLKGSRSSNLERALERVIEIRRLLSTTNVNSRLALEVFLLELSEIS